MAEKVISVLIEGGKATAGASLGAALGPMGINTGKVVAEINAKTKEFEGVTVPVKVIVNPVTKEFSIDVGAPPVSALIKKEIGLEKGSGKPHEEKVGDIPIDLIIKVARSKESTILARTPEKAVKEVLGACVPMGILVDGNDAREVQKEVDAGKFDDLISGKTPLREISKEELKKRQEELKNIVEAKHKEEEAAKVAEEAAKAAAAPTEAAPAAGTAPAATPEKTEAKLEEKKKEEKKK
jgi:large subunit ribosomal protein L11